MTPKPEDRCANPECGHPRSQHLNNPTTTQSCMIRMCLCAHFQPQPPTQKEGDEECESALNAEVGHIQPSYVIKQNSPAPEPMAERPDAKGACLPCPFCGAEAAIVTAPNGPRIYAKHGMFCILRAHVIYDFQLLSWNHRKQPPLDLPYPSEAVERVERQLAVVVKDCPTNCTMGVFINDTRALVEFAKSTKNKPINECCVCHKPIGLNCAIPIHLECARELVNNAP